MESKCKLLPFFFFFFAFLSTMEPLSSEYAFLVGTRKITVLARYCFVQRAMKKHITNFITT